MSMGTLRYASKICGIDNVIMRIQCMNVVIGWIQDSYSGLVTAVLYY